MAKARVAAAKLDSTVATPLVWAAYVADSAAAVALDDSIRILRRVTKTWDRAMLSYLRAVRTRDNHAIHAAAHEVLDAAPESGFALLVARSALTIGRAREALQLLAQMDPDTGLLKGSLDYWRVRTGAHHFLGEYREELAVARAALAQSPGDRIYMQAEIKALSGLGRGTEVLATCERALAHRARDNWNWQPCDQGVFELAAHGRRADSRRLAVRLAEGYRAALQVNDLELSLAVAEWLLAAGEVDSAQQALDVTVLHTPADSASAQWIRTAVRAANGDRSAVDAWVRRDTSGLPGAVRGERSVNTANLFALLDSRDEAAGWLARGLSEGFAWRMLVHVYPGFVNLRDHAPLAALLAPQDEPESAAIRVATRKAVAIGDGSETTNR